MKYIIIGLGNFGYVLAEELASMGHEIIGVDMNEQKVDSIKDKIATAFVLDATDDYALTALPLYNIDAVIVAIGENFGASIRVVALLKQKKVKHIFARAIDDIHKSVLEAFDIDKILSPEEDAARRLVELWEFNTSTEAFRLGDSHYVMKFLVPKHFEGYFVSELKLSESFNLNLIAIQRERAIKNKLGINVTEHYIIDNLGEEEKLFAGDELVCFGTYKEFKNFWKAY
ncbi:potassium channel family protein [Bacteroides propionicifaciens]|jgi:trk system potassium uptake protein|uniref:potassium channel family protein n=1 Tax=Bacteroides propionicifaciens TaxID=392838 RepID=UPI0003644E2F|nr:TrkA family potassium uptake protein [Bacteroides propionicifaciens]